MFIGILALAMSFGGLAATAALIIGQTLFAALVIYTGCGLLSVLAVVLAITVTSALGSRKTDLLQTDATAYN